ncbi:MAG TPA: methylated-DNA--[protein]-cysteine S-methyltransferase [Polyangiaceae bacterium]|nr:methylated-DNA--[protein]-cysteine S-methyltransferase [Polyangiaceae bacterium]
MKTETFQLERFNTPTGRMLVASDDQGRLRAVDWEDHEERLLRLLRRYYRASDVTLREVTRKSPARDALNAYFAGQLDALGSLKTVTNGTPFQREVWNALRRIPSGRTLSYGALAAKIGRPAAVRAVGLANGANPIAIVVPCHRVIGADASLTGYGGGLERKRWLLAHEGAEPALVSKTRLNRRPERGLGAL